MHDDASTAPAELQGRPATTAGEPEAAIERLERALAEERKCSAALRDTVEKLRFQAEVLDKSYSKQLADARQRAEAAERNAAALEARLAALDTSPEETIKLLAETRRELELVTTERDHLRKELARTGIAPVSSRAGERVADEEPDGTINRLMADPAWLQEPTAAPRPRFDATVRAEADEPPEIMLPPELVFTKRDGRDGER